MKNGYNKWRGANKKASKNYCKVRVDLPAYLAKDFSDKNVM